MRESVDLILAERKRREQQRPRGFPLLFSLLLHATLLTVFVLAPALAARHRQPPEFVKVQIIPSQRLGVAKPAVRQRPAKATAKTKERDQKPSPVIEKKPKPKPQPTLDKSSRKPAPQKQIAPSDAGNTDTGMPAERQGSPHGSSLGTATFGGVAGLDNPNFVYDYYIDQMLAAIGSRWTRPVADAGVEARVHFRIERDGTLEEVEVVAPSGLSSFDLAALRAVASSSPLPPLPNSYERDTLGVNLIFR